MILDVFRKGLYFVGGTLAVLAAVASIGWLFLAYGGDPGAGGNPAALYAVYFLASAIAVVVHELDQVEPWCASSLASDLRPDDRATVLATIAMARHGLGEPYEEPLAEAVALSPHADLVPEASGRIPSPQR
jgi:hypothetical protein